MYDVSVRERKARTMVAVLQEYLDGRLDELMLLNVGGSTGIIDNYLSDHFRRVVSVDIDLPAIRHAQEAYNRKKVAFHVADAMKLPFLSDSFDVVICSQVYEHVPDAKKMFDEIWRVLKPGGVCYFAASNRLRLNEPHYNLPLLSVLPRPLAHVYIRIAGKADHYYEKHLSYWGLKSLVRKFQRRDYTAQIVENPGKYFAEYMISPNTLKARLAKVIVKYFYWITPGYIWLLEKQSRQ